MSSNLLSVQSSKISRYSNNHFTASGLVIVHANVLLIHHKRIGAWLPPGGHIQPGEMPHEAAVREVFEETGVEVAVLSEAVPNTASTEHFFLPNPLAIHAVHAVEKQESLYHLDLVYICRPIKESGGLAPLTRTQEVHDVRWVPLADLAQLPLANNVTELVTLAKSKLNLD